jgi:PHD/YefM family antitoxin component YafN of YafNO toxin-antitoxin module
LPRFPFPHEILLTYSSLQSTVSSTRERYIMSTVMAGEIKKRGVSAFTAALKEDDEAVITVRGESRYVVMTMEKYNALRESELTQAVREARADYDAGRISDKSVEDHMRRIDDEV